MFGRSYGGYAALQSVVVDSSLFKTAVAGAPVTDLPTLTEQYRRTTRYFQMHDFRHQCQDLSVGDDGPGAYGRARQTRVDHFKGLDHQLDDSAARTEVLR